jgi:uncharacterized protein YehS (DUF1456 family)
MQIALDIGTINIQNQDIAKFIQNKSIEEIKALFLNFLTKEIEIVQSKPQHKWAEFGEKMNGLINQETAKELKESSKEFREGFSFRDLDR